jgi:hypothetical protein
MLTYSKNFGLPICFIVLVTEPPVREQLPDIGNVFFLEVAYGLAIPMFSLHKHVETTIMAL